jgi:hypothetical protein
MSATMLRVFAINGAEELRHTHLTRAQGLTAELPPIAEWLGVESLDTDRIEVFPVKDLGDMSLSDYLAMAFDPTPMEPATRTRLDALEGTVLIAPDTAFSGDPDPGTEATEIAALPLSVPDHSADLPKADTAPAPPRVENSEPETPRKSNRLSQAAKFAIFIGIFIILFILLDG